jgi:hypothetical protein
MRRAHQSVEFCTHEFYLVHTTNPERHSMGPTPKQKKYAKSLGIELYGDESRADVSELIEAAKLDRDTKRYGDASLDPMIGCVRCVPIIAVVCVFAGLSWNWFWAFTIAAAFIVARPELWVMMVGTVAFGMWIPWYFDSGDWTPCWGAAFAWFSAYIASLAMNGDKGERIPWHHWDGRSRKVSDEVKATVRKRDGNECVKCGSTRHLHFDHIYPHSKGGSNSERNIQLLCERCNLSKADKIESQATIATNPKMTYRIRAIVGLCGVLAMWPGSGGKPVVEVVVAPAPVAEPTPEPVVMDAVVAPARDEYRFLDGQSGRHGQVVAFASTRNPLTLYERLLQMAARIHEEHPGPLTIAFYDDRCPENVRYLFTEAGRTREFPKTERTAVDFRRPDFLGMADNRRNQEWRFTARDPELTAGYSRIAAALAKPRDG